MQSPANGKLQANPYLASNSVTESPVMAMLGDQQGSKTSKLIDRRVLSTTSLVAIAYMLCCSTPDGNEPLITYGGPLASFGILFAFVLCYTIPFSYVVAELSTAFPDDGGVAVWVMNAFGPFWGFQTGFWTWVSLICACASSPNSMYQRLEETYGFVASPVVATLVKMVFALLLALPSFFGVRIVGRLSFFLMVIVLTPFVFLTVVSYARGDSWGDLFAIRRETNTTLADGRLEFTGPVQVDYIRMLRDLFYGFDGIVLMSVFGGEVRNPAVTYSSAIFIKLALQVASLVFPLSSAIVNGKPAWYEFDYGTFTQIAQSIGSFLESLVQLSTDCSTVGFFLAGMFSQAYLVYGMANTSMIPRQMAHRNSQFGTPNVAAFLGVFVVMLCIVFNPPLIDSIASAFSAMSQLVVILTVIQLRRVLPDAIRPTKVPGNVVALCAVMVIPVVILCFMVYTAFSSFQTTIMTVTLVVVGLVFGAVFQYCASHQQLHEQPQPYDSDIEVGQEFSFQ